jgi:UDP-glucuronate 4-epimerase
MRYVVTGSAGFIGHHVCETLLDLGHAVVGVDAFTDYYDPSLKRANARRLTRDHDRYQGFELDLTSCNLDDLLDGADAVIHLAGQPGVHMSWSDGFELYVRNNVWASQRVLEAVRRTRVPRTVLASSSSVYGNASTTPITEDSTTRPFSPYGVTKLAMEHLAGAYSDNWNVSTVILRYFTVYGPGQRPDMAMHRFITAASTGQPITVYGDGEQIRDFTYVSDAVAATVAATVADVEPGIVLNIAGREPTTVNDLVGIMSRHLGCPVLRDHLAARAGDVRATNGSIDRARRLLGWQPETRLDDGVKRQVDYQLGAVVS